MTATTAKYLVTGASGQLGALAIDALLKKVPASQVVALVRRAEAAAPLAAAPRLEGLLVEFQRAVVGDRLDRLVPSALPAALLALLATTLLAAALLAGTLVLLVLLALLALAAATASTTTAPSATLAGTCARFAIALTALVARRWARLADSGLRYGWRRDRPRGADGRRCGIPGLRTPVLLLR